MSTRRDQESYAQETHALGMMEEKTAQNSGSGEMILQKERLPQPDNKFSGNLCPVGYPALNGKFFTQKERRKDCFCQESACHMNMKTQVEGDRGRGSLELPG